MRRAVPPIILLLLFTAVILANPQDSEVAPEIPLFINVKDFGAVGDGKTDDTEAIQQAIDAAGYKKVHPLAVATSTVLFPPGHYRVTKSLVLSPRKGSSHIMVKGSGGVERYGGIPSAKKRLPKGTSQIFWGGADTDAVLFEVLGVGGVIFRNITLSGDNKKITLLRVNAPPGYGAGRYTFYNVSFVNAKMGTICGDNSKINSADMSFYDCTWADLDTAFQTTNCQNVDYAFYRPYIEHCKLGMYFKQGGLVYASMPTFICTNRAIQIDGGGKNVGAYVFDMLHSEQSNPLEILVSKAEATVTFTGLSPQTISKENRAPLFDISGQTMVSVIGSNLTRTPIAKVSGNAFIKFDTCKFAGAKQKSGKSYDPRKSDVVTIEGKDAGCEVVSSFHYSTFIKHWAKYPGSEEPHEEDKE